MNTEIIKYVQTKHPVIAKTLIAFMIVETVGKGFDETTGKIIIQFEPAWFRKNAPYAPSGKWSLNKIEQQKAEWVAFNDAYKLNPIAAMESTSIGIRQIMGYHWKRLDYKNVGEMWDDAKKGIPQQINQIIKFIFTDTILLMAIENNDWHTIASIYNGKKYRELAKRLGRVPYDEAMKNEYEKLQLK